MTKTSNMIIIAACARNHVIGHNNQLPWRLPADLSHFKTTTLGHPIIMGRLTWESLSKPLPGRHNIVVSHTLPIQHSPTFSVVNSLSAAQSLCQSNAKIYLIGGAQLYQAALIQGYVDKMLITEIDADYPGDAYFPPIDLSQWQVTQRIEGQDNSFAYPFHFVTYERT